MPDNPTTVPQVPDYELLSCVWRDACWDVWRAWNAAGAWRDVTIVYFDRCGHAHVYDSVFDGIRKFEKVSGVHEGLVTVFHVGRNEQAGYCYYVVEAADDDVSSHNFDPQSYKRKDLRREIQRRGRLPLSECLSLGLSVTSALEHLHQNGFVHRNIRPGNIIFVKGLPKLAGIELVAEIGEPSDCGTPAYIPPEGHGKPTGDLFSLGMILYETSTGRRREDFPLLPTDLVADTTEKQFIEFNKILLKACAVDVSARYPSAGAMQADLELVQQGRRVTNPGPAHRQSISSVSQPDDKIGSWFGLRLGRLFRRESANRKRMQEARRCPVCSAELSAKGECLACLVRLSNATSQSHTTVKVEAPGSPLGHSEAGDNAEKARVEKLLRSIAAQSHFEERYDVREKLAQGGMGVILKAYDRILRRDVAIKMMARETFEGSDTAAIRGQFLKEARVGGRLLHPNVLAVFDLGVNREGKIYYTMRLVDGDSLQRCLDVLEKGTLTKLVSYPLRRVVEVFLGACHGVDFAHQNRILHLDLKPSNILVSGFKEVFVIDWGLARVDDVDDTERLVDLYRDASVNPETSATRATGAFGGRIVGTPGYMAPEQARGEIRCFNETTDVYGLGGVLYFILYGTAPNQADSVIEMRQASFASKKRGRLRPSIRPRGHRVRKEVQGAIESLQSICLKALEPEQEKRYENIEAFIIELNDWLATTPPDL